MKEGPPCFAYDNYVLDPVAMRYFASGTTGTTHPFTLLCGASLRLLLLQSVTILTVCKINPLLESCVMPVLMFI